MKKQKASKPPLKKKDEKKDDKRGDPLYPPGEDIYNNFKEEQDIDPEDVTKRKETEKDVTLESGESDPLPLDFENDEIMGTDLDVPGSELDDDLEELGDEDEENNYYSIGGDKHHDLEEDDGSV